ncbi:TIGR04053 family radical SAM/SPASM domain-containing protein [Brevibacillus migulae]|uniref:TIGR04053 family radical SAM/SPASM domain-containing protein n=1 Tax=Brevibacillus migulae TaxID=1644114 RepID=UPI001F322D68|nr:TIGR04053 family radical SAM/SPASM domain-containing protein [Brevibacillus migulae]
MSAYAENPFIAIWEVTRACALRCLHCRAVAQPHRDPRELSTEEGKRLIDQIHEMDNPLLVFTGGDPLMRPDLFELIRYAVAKGMRVSMTPSATPRVTEEAIVRAKEAGLARWAFSVDGPNAEVHDQFRGTRGSYDLTVKALSLLKKHGLPIQINTTVSRYNVHLLEEMAELVESWGAVLWSVFFLVPTGRGQAEDMISAEEHEQVFEWLAEKSSKVSYGIKTTAAPAYRRVLLTKRKKIEASPGGAFKRPDAIGRSQQGVTDGKGFVFISHIGEVSPSGFLPLPCGNIRELPLARIYRESPVFSQIRNPDLLKGKCGVCPYRETCGGSRARAYGMTGDYLESDPSCAYIPPGWIKDEGELVCSKP